MSFRNLRKLYGSNALPPPEDNSDEEYQPLYVKNTSAFKYQGLVVSSESEHDNAEADDIDNEDEGMANKKKKKKKKKKKQHKQKEEPTAEPKEDIMLDEIDRCVMEVNAMLGSPPPVAPAAAPPKPDPKVLLLGINHKHLNASNELTRLFGPEPQEGKRRARPHNTNRFTRKATIVPITENLLANFQKGGGLSMSIQRREGDITYFTFDHSRHYQKNHRAFLATVNYNLRSNNIVVSIEESQLNMHVEGLLENADTMFRLEEYTTANSLVEQVIAYMQYIAHPAFNILDQKTRLEYRFMENRPFIIAVFKYMYLLTNKACHRTALELAKLLLNLDPLDPLAVLFVIDTLALRAREHQWLIDATEYWSKERDACFMFNIHFSYALSNYHVLTKAKLDTKNADKLLRSAMLRFPSVFMRIMECASMTPSARLKSHPLFTTIANDMTGKSLSELIQLYAKLSWARWREPGVFEWLTRNANELADEYDNDNRVQAKAKELAYERLNMFQGWPDEILRHLSIIKPMSELLVDGAVPRVNRRSTDPLPPVDSVNRYGYGYQSSTSNYGVSDSPLYALLFAALRPQYDLPQLDLTAEDLEEQRNAMGLQEVAEVLNDDDDAGVQEVRELDPSPVNRVLFLYSDEDSDHTDTLDNQENH